MKIIAVMYATFAVAKREPEKNSGFLFATAKLAYITAMIFIHYNSSLRSSHMIFIYSSLQSAVCL